MASNQVSIAGIVIGAVVGLVLVGSIIAYCFSADSFMRRRGWFKKRSQRKNGSSQHLRPDDEESLTKRASFVSERESIMFSRSRASSLQFAVVEDIDAQRRTSSQVYVLRGEQYVPLQNIDTEQNSLISRGASPSLEADEPSFENEPAAQSSIPVVVSPPPENTPNSMAGSIHRYDTVSEVSAPLTHASS